MPYINKTGTTVPDFSVKPHRWVHGELSGCKLCNPCDTACAFLGPCAVCHLFFAAIGTWPRILLNGPSLNFCHLVQAACVGCARCKFDPCKALCEPCLKPCKATCEPCKATCEPHCAKCKAGCEKCPKCPPACTACAGLCLACKCNPECIKCTDGICLKCRGPCKPVCGICKGLDLVCEAGPGCECKTVGCELTCGVPAVEAQLGVWHIATDMFPSKLPAILYPCLFGPVCCPGGKDEKKEGDSFSIGGPTVGENVKLMRFCCGCCSPYAVIKKSIWGLALDPPFDGDIPAWYNAGPANATATDGSRNIPVELVGASNFGASDNYVCSHCNVTRVPCKSSTRVPSQLVM